MNHRTAWGAPLRAAALTAAALAIQPAWAVEPADNSEIAERFNVADNAPVAQNAYLDDSNGVAANDGVVEVVKDRYTSGKVRVERCVILDSDKNYVNHGAWKMFD